MTTYGELRSCPGCKHYTPGIFYHDTGYDEPPSCAVAENLYAEGACSEAVSMIIQDLLFQFSVLNNCPRHAEKRRTITLKGKQVINQDRTLVFCNSLNCAKQLHVPMTAREPTATRFHVWNNQWFIDIHSPRYSVLTSLEIDTADGLRRYCDPQHGFDFAKDQHYCSIECAAEDA